MSKRLYYLDIISALFIVEIILMHIFMWAGLFVKTNLYYQFETVFSFYMPWFYFKSGMFNRDNQSLKDTIKIGFKRLIIPCIIFNIIGLLIDIPFKLIYTDVVWYKTIGRPIRSFILVGCTSGNPALWFLLSLFFVKILFTLICNKKISWIIILFPLVGWILSINNIVLPLTFSSLFLGVVFYYLGFLYQKYNYFNSLVISIICFIVYIIIISFYRSHVDMISNTIGSGNYLLWFLSSVSGIILLLKTGSYFTKNTFISNIGEDSMMYYVTHMIIMLGCTNLLSVFGFANEGYQYAIILLCANLILLPLVNIFFKTKVPSWVLGK